MPRDTLPRSQVNEETSNMKRGVRLEVHSCKVEEHSCKVYTKGEKSSLEMAPGIHACPFS